MDKKGWAITMGVAVGIAAWSLLAVTLIVNFPNALHWLWTDAGFVFQLMLGALITWVIFWFIRRMHPEQPVGEVIRAHFSTSRKLGLFYGAYHFLGEPPLRAAEWCGYQFTCWLLDHHPRAGKAWVSMTRPWVMRWRQDGEALKKKEAARIARWEQQHGE